MRVPTSGATPAFASSSFTNTCSTAIPCSLLPDVPEPMRVQRPPRPQRHHDRRHIQHRHRLTVLVHVANQPPHRLPHARRDLVLLGIPAYKTHHERQTNIQLVARPHLIGTQHDSPRLIHTNNLIHARRKRRLRSPFRRVLHARHALQ